MRSGLRRENRGIPNTDPGKAIACGACGAADGSPDMSCAEDASEAGPGRRITALVKWFMPMKGYGFLEPEDGSADLFCHPAVVQASGYETLPQGAVVTCEAVPGDRGPQASRIFSVDPPATGHGAAKRNRPFDAGYSGIIYVTEYSLRQPPRPGFGSRISSSRTGARSRARPTISGVAPA